MPAATGGGGGGGSIKSTCKVTKLPVDGAGNETAAYCTLIKNLRLPSGWPAAAKVVTMPLSCAAVKLAEKVCGALLLMLAPTLVVPKTVAGAQVAAGLTPGALPTIKALQVFAMATRAPVKAAGTEDAVVETVPPAATFKLNTTGAAVLSAANAEGAAASVHSAKSADSFITLAVL